MLAPEGSPSPSGGSLCLLTALNLRFRRSVYETFMTPKWKKPAYDDKPKGISFREPGSDPSWINKDISSIFQETLDLSLLTFLKVRKIVNWRILKLWKYFILLWKWTIAMIAKQWFWKVSGKRVLQRNGGKTIVKYFISLAFFYSRKRIFEFLVNENNFPKFPAIIRQEIPGVVIFPFL